MDLPSCPSCRQSVLDDDAEVCPFCGAPMKGGAPTATARAGAKPSAAPPRPTARPEPASRPDSKSAPAVGAKPAKPAAAASAPNKPTKPAPAPAPATRGTPRPSKPTKSKSLSEEDLFGDDLDLDSPSSSGSSAAPVVDDGGDPLEVKSSAGKDAIPASRQRTKSRPQKVVCPMCETVGYIPTTAAGKEVRCANPKCLVPVFVAPRIQKKATEEAAPKKGSPVATIATVLLCILAVGGAGWYWFNQSATRTRSPQPPTPVSQTPPVAPNSAKPPEQVGKVPEKPPAPPEPSLTLAEERDPVLEIMQRSAQTTDRNLRPAYCQRVVAHTAADCGKFDIARKYLDLLEHGQKDLAFYRIAPLTSMAWQQLKQKDESAAGKLLDQAMQATAELPTMGRDAIEFTAQLAAALVAVGRDQEAKSLVAHNPASGPNGRLVALTTTASTWNTWDTVAAENERPLLDLPSLQCPLVVEIAVSRGYAPQALRFAESLENQDERAQTLIAWGQAVARAQARAKSADLSSVEPVAARLDPANRARLQARLGSERLRAGDRPGAEKLLAAAITSLGEIPSPKEFAIPPAKKLATFDFHDPAPARVQSLALAEIARLEGALDKRADAQKHLELAVAVLRAAAPNKNAAKQMVEEAGHLRYTAFEEAVPKKGRKEAIALARQRNQQRARAALERVRQTSKALAAAADSRFDLQTQILASAVAWDDGAHLWQMIAPHATAADPGQKEAYFDTPIPWELVVKLRHSGDKATAEKILEAKGSSVPPAETVLDLLAQKVTDTADVDSLAHEMQRVRKDSKDGPIQLERSDRERATLAGSSYLLRAGKVPQAIEFVRMFDDSQLKEESLEWTVALAGRLNHARQAKEILQAASFIPTESVSAYRGLLLGLLARESAPEANPVADGAEKSQAAASSPKP